MIPISESFYFSPDLIIEATSVCDRSCNGCYAPNVISRANAKELQKSFPKLFLSPDLLESSFQSLKIESSSLPITVSFRGGEPSRNPALATLLHIAGRWAKSLFIETHGRFVINSIAGEEQENRSLIDALRSTRTIVKISFDKMHGLSPKDLQRITDLLDVEQIDWCVAITEASEDAFTQSRQLCSWIPNDRIIYQAKAYSISSLIRPRFGVIRPDGSHSGLLSVRDSLFTTAPGFSTRKQA